MRHRGAQQMVIAALFAACLIYLTRTFAFLLTHTNSHSNLILISSSACGLRREIIKIHKIRLNCRHTDRHVYIFICDRLGTFKTTHLALTASTAANFIGVDDKENDTMYHCLRGMRSKVKFCFHKCYFCDKNTTNIHTNVADT